MSRNNGFLFNSEWHLKHLAVGFNTNIIILNIHKSNFYLNDNNAYVLGFQCIFTCTVKVQTGKVTMSKIVRAGKQNKCNKTFSQNNIDILDDTHYHIKHIYLL